MEHLKISNIRQLNSQTVYDIQVADAHHYVLGNGVVCHNSGLIYVSDSIAMLSKSKEKDKEKNVIGSIITVKMFKSRLSRENTESECRISYSGGLDRWYGVLDMAIAAGMVKATNGRFTFPGSDKTVLASKIAESPESFFTEAFMQELDTKFVKPNFSYGSMVQKTNDSDTEDEE